MRALCGAIITAGALIGLGLLSIGMGTRYAGVAYLERDNNWVKFHQMDSPLMFTMVFLVILCGIGLAIAFVGLAYHHHRRFHEIHRDHRNGVTETHVRETKA